MSFTKPLLRCAASLLFTITLLFGAMEPAAYAGGPRFVSGDGWGVPHGWNVVWDTTTLLYYTDPGPLGAGVTHAQADAIVAAAAAVWTTPTSSISFAKGGELAEDVSTANTYFDGTGMVLPADVQAANESNIPIAILYDVDGGLVDLLLGEGASDPDICRQNAVVGDVDDIHQSDGKIHHATLILNGRCVGSATEQLTQMQYQLARAFGRVLGLSWSQTNDNVFTAETTITQNQMGYWPLMHPLDVICGNYSYQCMANPFTLRVDDLNSLAQLYPIFQSAVPPGKQATSDDALWLWGILYFPDGQGMDWVNITTHRQNSGITEDWETTSSITGVPYSQAAGTPVDRTPAANSGSTSDGLDGYFNFRRVPLNGLANVFFTTEPINPLYTGDYAIGPYVRPPVTPSGAPATYVAWSALPGGDRSADGFMTPSNASPNCDPGADGTESLPAPLDSSGWQNGLLCGWDHSSWWTVAIADGHTWTVEVNATDETGSATVNKVQPIVGVWNATDPESIPPSIASEPVPFNSMVLGMTQMAMGPATGNQSYRFSVSDQFGGGRPDFTYTTRVLYADKIVPDAVGSGGGQIVVTGMGFRQGNQVLINGAPARVLSWTPNQIVADAPSMATCGAQPGTAVDISVLDPGTGATTTIPAGITYTSAPDLLVELSAPAALETGLVSTVPLSIRVVASDGTTPVVNATVSLAVSAGSANLGVCGTENPCIAITDGNGVVQTTVSGGAPGPVSLTATEISGGASLQINLADTAPVQAVNFSKPQHWVAAGTGGTWTLQFNAMQDGEAASGVPVTWAVSGGMVADSADQVTGEAGGAQLVVSSLSVASGSVNTVIGCAWSTVCATWTIVGVDPSQWLVRSASSPTQNVERTAQFSPVQLVTTDLYGHPLEGAPVQVYQRVLAWEGPCPSAGPCASAPVLTATEETFASNSAGLIEVDPLQISGIPQVLEIAISTGTNGFLAMTLTKAP